MEYLDIIGIGAINYDYIFFCKKLEYKNRMLPEFGQEYLNSTHEVIYEGEPSIALVRLVKGTRNWIDINTGVNSKLQEFIVNKEKQEGDNAFVEYLSKSKWIHMSSDFNQFQFLVQKVREAKEINPMLRVSVDPGVEYTKDYKLGLRDVFSIADYVFLN